MSNDKLQNCNPWGKVTHMVPNTLQTRLIIKPYRLAVGIDPGVATGFAVWNRQLKQFIAIETLGIYQAIKQLERIKRDNPENWDVLIRIEDARKRKVFNKSAAEGKGPGFREGVGSVKRDSGILEEVCLALELDYELLAPAGTKWEEAYFRQVTGWTKRTSKHSRDAAVRVFKY